MPTRDMRAARTTHSNFALAAAAAPCPIPVLPRFVLDLALRARAGRLRRPDCALHTHADPHILCPLPQWVFVPNCGSIGPAHRVSMLDVWCCARVCARINAHTRSPTPITYIYCSNECLYQFRPRSVQPCGRLCWMCMLRAHQCAPATAEPHNFCPLFQ
jgi:hypothetical protein